ncbi:MAG: nicotinate-nucleotide adenylyltransferase [Lachnospiraceae bacterium]
MGRTGIMGGTFNPVHIAHIKMAEAAYRQANLDKVVFMPSKNPPHKKDIHIIPEEHRSAMLKLAISGIPYFAYSDFEFKREGITYSSQTLGLLHMQNPGEKYFFIMGSDSFFQLESWHMPGQIMEYAAIIAINRNGTGRKQMEEYAKELRERYNAEIIIAAMPQMDISSSCIREIILSGGDASMYLPGKVWEYIKEKNCYSHLNML